MKRLHSTPARLLAAAAACGALAGAPGALADPCHLSIVLDRTGSMGEGDDVASKCSIALEFATGVIQGYINGDNVSIVPADPSDPATPLIDADFYDSRCPLAERRVEVYSVSNPFDGDTAPVSLTSGFVEPAVALAQLQALAATDGALTTSCLGLTPLADTMCLAASSLRAASTGVTDTRLMKIVTDGGENASDLADPTNCDAGVGFGDPSYESQWIANTFSEMAFGGVGIQFDAIMFTDLFFAPGARPEGGPSRSSASRLSTAEANFLTTLAINTGGTAEFVDELPDVATTFSTPGDAGIDTCASDLDADFDVDNLDALLFSQDFNNNACQISTRSIKRRAQSED
jgi:hypothetical protein